MTVFLPDETWAAVVKTLKAIGPVLSAREQVEAVHETPAEAAAIDRLGRRLADLEDAYDALRAHHETVSKDA